MTAIEKLWKDARADTKQQKMNGSLLEQATYICTKCGHEKLNDYCQCIYCGDTECDNAQ